MAAVGLANRGSVRVRHGASVAAASPHGFGTGPWGSALLDVADRLALSFPAGRSAAAVQSQHLLSAAPDADLLRRDALAVAHGRAVAGGWHASSRRVQRPVPLELRAVRPGDVRSGGVSDRVAARGLHRRSPVRVLSVSLSALQPSRTADDLLDAAGPACVASVSRHATRTLCRGGRAVHGRPALFVDVLRRVLRAVP